MPEIIMTGPDTFVVRGSEADRSDYIRQLPMQQMAAVDMVERQIDRAALKAPRAYGAGRLQEVRALPENINVVRTENKPPPPTGLGRPDMAMSPLWPVKINTANEYGLTDEARRDLYLTPGSYQPSVDFDEAKREGWAGRYVNLSRPMREVVAAAGGMDYPEVKMNVRVPYFRTPATQLNATEVPMSMLQDFPAADPERLLIHEWMHEQQYDNPDVRAGMQAMTDTPWGERGWERYGPSRLQRLENYMPWDNVAEREGHAEMAESPWLFSPEEREQFYPGVFRPDAYQSELPQPNAWRGGW